MTEPTHDEPGVRDLVEIRIHGVSGTSRESLLEHADAIQVAGDGRSGFHRRRGWHAYGPAEAVGDVGPVRRHLEAFSWGGLTSGAASRAAWLLLLPFALVNVAAWAIPAADPQAGGLRRADRRAPWDGTLRRSLLRLLRVFALTLTIGFVTTAVTVAMDVVGWQCGAAVDRCYAGRDNRLHDVLAWIVRQQPGTRLALTAVAPLVVITALWALAGRSYRAYEAAGSADAGNGYVGGRQTPFALRTFWRRNDTVARLRSIHVSSAYATVAAITSRSLVPGPMRTALTAAACAVLAGCVALLLFSRAADLGDELLGRSSRVARLPGLLRYGALALVLATLAGAVRGLTPVRSQVLPGLEGALEWTALVQGPSLVAVLVLTLVHLPWRASGQPFVRGLLTPALSALAAVVAAVMSTGVVYRVVDVLRTPATPVGQEPEAPAEIALHGTYGWISVLTAFYVPALAIALGVVAGYVGWRARTTSATRRNAVRADYAIPDGALPPFTEARVGEVATARFVARLTECGAPVLAAVGVTGALLGPLAWWLDGVDDAWLDDLWWEPATIQDFGANAIVALMVGLVLLGGLAYRKDGMRRSVGILWDLSTFWPRAAHPLAPPCYCERVVPQLATRLNGLARPGTAVLLSAHSQGSVIAAATVVQLPPETLGRMALLTHGCPLNRLYARAFPAYFSVALFEAVDEALGGDAPGRWRNLWRKTDYLGRWVFSPENDVDSQVEDPPAHPRPPACDEDDLPLHAALGDIVAPAPLRHSNYYVSIEYDRVVQELDGVLGATAPAGPVDPRYPAMPGGRAPNPAEVERAPAL